MPGERAQEIGRLIAQAAKMGGARYVNGITTAAPASGRITVDLGYQTVPATIPGDFRATLAAGQDVQLVVQGTQYVVNKVLSALPAPAVPATGSNASTDGTVFDGMYLYLYGDVAGVAAYAYDIAEVVNYHGGDLNDLRAKYDDLVSKYNTLKNAVVAEVLAALRSQGNIT